MEELSLQLPGTNVTVSPCGNLIAYASNNNVQVHYVHALDRSTSISCQISSKDVSILKWSPSSERIAVGSASIIEVIDLDDIHRRVRLRNGSAGFGKFSSADFIDDHHLLTAWEFGKTKIWSLSNGKTFEIGDLKTTCSGSNWLMRPLSETHDLVPTVAALSRLGADDVLTVIFPATQQSMQAKRLPSTDAQSLSWSPDGRWIAILDTPVSNHSAIFCTPDGHIYRSVPSMADLGTTGLGARALVWSSDSRYVAVSTFDSKIALLNTRTFATSAIIEHTTTIHQHATRLDLRAPIWREVVSASNQRSYAVCSQPFSPPLHRPKTGTEPKELGIAECCFSCDGKFLASRDERIPGTVWIWNVELLTAHAFLVQHNPVRKIHWHPSRPERVMLDCGEGIVYLFDVTRSEPPLAISISHPVPAHLSWVQDHRARSSAILAASKTSFRLLYPEGRDADFEGKLHPHNDDSFEEGVSDDSIFDVLSGRKPMPPKTEPSYTEMVDLEAAELDGHDDILLDDTFREKRKPLAEELNEVDPFDDSEIF